MISFPSRLRAAREQIEAGESVDWGRLAELQALDIAIIGEEFAEESIRSDEAATNELERLLNA